MTPRSNSEERLLIIDTEDYSGNFERDMCAWVTGQFGECGVGKEVAAEALDDMSPELRAWCEMNVKSKPDENGCRRPCSISPTPGWFNSGLGLQYRDGTDPELVRKEYNECVLKQAERTIQIYAHMPEYGAKQAQEWKDNHLDKPGKHPAYLSVEIYLDSQPSDELLSEMVERAKGFCRNPSGRFAGFRHTPIAFVQARLVRVFQFSVTTHIL